MIDILDNQDVGEKLGNLIKKSFQSQLKYAKDFNKNRASHIRQLEYIATYKEYLHHISEQVKLNTCNNWDDLVGYSFMNRLDNPENYEKFIYCMFHEYKILKRYAKSDLFKNDLQTLTEKELVATTMGIEIPCNIKTNIEINITDNLSSCYRYLLGKAKVSYYDTVTNIKSKVYYSITVSMELDEGYNSMPHYSVMSENKQNIRAMLKQFIKDMA